MSKRFLITTDSIGGGELGKQLARNFMRSLARADETPSTVMLMNEAVRLACEGSEVLDDLRLLADKGVAVKVCGACLEFLGLENALVIGGVGTMNEGVAAFLAPDEIVTIS
ncbi:MAG: DsrE family protein [Actinomycetota bacterium]|jgi:intracellular sulfur oxidation DsrE/DsrF family protein|nr:DsrE family protein [Actinomycetota bacterium]